MPKKKTKDPVGMLSEAIVDALLDKKAFDPVILDFTKINSSLCDSFIICHGTSRTQTEALADGVIAGVKKKTGLNPYHKEGFENAEWILIDYGDIIVHIFQESMRKFYNLEQLWGDAEITKVNPNPKKQVIL
ncbi:MAG: ribosome silencing factor [Bacteroidetes bacterium]|nr:ribosome silencing factor [Bacteroidota bacterium]